MGEGVGGDWQYSPVALRYDSLSSIMPCWEWYRDSILLSAIEKRIPYGTKRILDLCCGNGLLAEHLAQRRPDCHVECIDISREMVIAARDRLKRFRNVSVEWGNWVSGVPVGEKFDCVVIKNSLHLIPSLEIRLAQLRRIVSDSCVIIICETVSPAENSNEFVKHLFRLINYSEIKHAFFCRRTFFRQLKRSGLVRLRARCFIDQNVNLMAWLCGKCDGTMQTSTAFEYLAQAACDSELRRQMNILLDEAGRPVRMRRLQQIETLTFKDCKVSLERASRHGGRQGSFW